MGEKLPLDFSPQRWMYPVFVLNYLLYADKLTKGECTEADAKASLPLLDESPRVKDIFHAMADVLREGYAKGVLQKVGLGLGSGWVWN